MSSRAELHIAKISQQCNALADVILCLRSVYETANAPQRALIETMIGAAIWYLPKPPDAWTGYVSLGALRAFHPDSGVMKPKFSEEHVLPRKIAARLLLQNEKLDQKNMTKLFREKYGRFHFITSEENKTVQPFQRIAVFTTPDDVYRKAGIVLIKVKREALINIKKRNRETIEDYIRMT
jgi:hypothetical protein